MVVYNDSIVDSISHSRWSNVLVTFLFLFQMCTKKFKNEHFSTSLHGGYHLSDCLMFHETYISEYSIDSPSRKCILCWVYLLCYITKKLFYVW